MNLKFKTKKMVPLCYIILYSSEKRFLSCALMPINLLLVLVSKGVLDTLSFNNSSKLEKLVVTKPVKKLVVMAGDGGGASCECDGQDSCCGVGGGVGVGCESVGGGVSVGCDGVGGDLGVGCDGVGGDVGVVVKVLVVALVLMVMVVVLVVMVLVVALVVKVQYVVVLVVVVVVMLKAVVVILLEF